MPLPPNLRLPKRAGTLLVVLRHGTLSAVLGLLASFAPPFCQTLVERLTCMKTSRPIRLAISPLALRHNYLVARQAAPQARIWAVIKANAYGHGQWRVVQALRQLADGFALLECENAVALRESGVEQPILLLEGVFTGRDVRAAAEFSLTMVIHHLEQLALVQQHWPADKPLLAYLKLNSGMNRLGLDQAGLRRALALLAVNPANQITLMSHFAEADGGRGVDWQLDNFRGMVGDWSGPVSLANSAALLRYPQTHADWVRPGIMLYGASPFAEVAASTLGLQPAMTLHSAGIALQQVLPGDQVGYGGAFVAERPMRLGVVACGYADGYPRHAPSGTPIAVMGRSTVTVGRVSMDMLAIDLTDIPQAGLGSPVTLWGKGAGGEVAVDAVAKAAGTIAYELFCAVAPRVPVELGEF